MQQSLLNYSIGKKIIMSFTGLLLALFLLAHVAGNLLLLISPELFNDYAHNITKNPAILYTAEFGLIALVLAHIAMAIRLTRQNVLARPIPYEVKANSGRSRRSWGSSRMGITGSAVLAFVIFHIWHFKFGEEYLTEQGSEPIRDLARLVTEEFNKPLIVGIYLGALLLIGTHLLHGFRSMFDTLGLASKRWEKFFDRLTKIYVVTVFGGFILIPLYLYFFNTGGF